MNEDELIRQRAAMEAQLQALHERIVGEHDGEAARREQILAALARLRTDVLGGIAQLRTDVFDRLDKLVADIRSDIAREP